MRVSIDPLGCEKTLQAINLTDWSSSIRRAFIRVTAFGSSANENLADHYASALKKAVGKEFSGGDSNEQFTIEEECVVEATATATHQKKKSFRGKKPKERTAVSALVVLETATDGIISVDQTVNVNESTASIFADQVISRLNEYVHSGAWVDEHLADNVVVFMALAEGTSRVRVPGKAHRTSKHLETALDIAARLTGATYQLHEEDTSAIVEVNGVGLQRRA